jgi:hypothetical protein
LRHSQPNFRNIIESGDTCFYQSLQGAEMPGEYGSRPVAHVTNSQGIDEVGEIAGLARVNLFKQIFS